MSNREFTLAALVPDPITIRIGELVLAGRSADTFGVEDAVRLEWLQKEFAEVEQDLGGAEGADKAGQIALAHTAENLLNDMVRIIVPDVTDEQLRIQIPFARKMGLVQWWQKLMEETQAGGGTPGSKKAARTPAQRSPASSTPTRSRPPTS